MKQREKEFNYNCSNNRKSDKIQGVPRIVMAALSVKLDEEIKVSL